MVTGRDGSSRSVLHFVDDWLPASEVFVYDLVRNLHRPSLVVTPQRIHNADRFPLPEVHSLVPLLRVVRPRSLHPAAVTAVLAGLARYRRVELVHVHHGYGIDHVLGLLARRPIPLVLSLHGHDVTGYLEQRPDAYRDAIERVGAVVVPSRFLAGHAVAAGFDPERVHVLPSGIDTAYFSPTALPEGPPMVLFVGRFVAKKGLDVLASAWPA
ncbi:MAG: glycosyltransferase, partial [Acidimicrobiales bacterium]